jgi:hypothetical protein
MTETFKPIPILLGFYVSDLGRIRKNSNTFPALHISSRGIVTLHTRIEGHNKCHTVARLVYNAFVGDCTGFVVGYLDGNKTNCKAENLYLLTKGNDMAKARETRWGKK